MFHSVLACRNQRCTSPSFLRSGSKLASREIFELANHLGFQLTVSSVGEALKLLNMSHRRIHLAPVTRSQFYLLPGPVAFTTGGKSRCWSCYLSRLHRLRLFLPPVLPYPNTGPPFPRLSGSSSSLKPLEHLCEVCSTSGYAYVWYVYLFVTVDIYLRFSRIPMHRVLCSIFRPKPQSGPPLLELAL